MKTAILILIALLVFTGCKESKPDTISNSVIAEGQMPNLAKDDDANLHLVYGSGDSIMYSFSQTKGQSFSSPSLIALLPEVAASHTRGPQMAVTSEGLLVTASTDSGNIYS